MTCVFRSSTVLLQTVRRLGTGNFRGHKPVNCTMYIETEVSGSMLSDSEKYVEKRQLGTAIPV